MNKTGHTRETLVKLSLVGLRDFVQCNICKEKQEIFFPYTPIYFNDFTGKLKLVKTPMQLLKEFLDLHCVKHRLSDLYTERLLLKVDKGIRNKQGFY